MRLKSLKIKPLGQAGWESPLLVFGHRTTLIFAPNGSGKTPVIQALASCLGFPSKFRDDILGKCSGATLVAEVNGQEISIHRSFSSNPKEFFATISIDKKTTEYFSEGAFSANFFSILGLNPPALVSTNKQATKPYISTVLPLFYLNQGDGYAAAYKAPSAFIEDQFVEMVRFVFGLNPKHSYEAKRNLISLKESLEAVTRKIVVLQRFIENQTKDRNISDSNQASLLHKASALTAQIENLRTSADANSAANSTLTDLLKQKDRQIQETQREIEEHRSRIYGIETIKAEIEGEINTLGLNEEARRVFISFQEICKNHPCGLFMGSSETYGKNLLYLRDQIKDLERNTSRAELKIELLEKRLTELRAERLALVIKLEAPGATKIDQLVTAVHALTKQLIDIENERASIEAIHVERSKLFRLEQERSRIQDSIEQLTQSNRSDLDFNRLRQRLKELTVKWMDILDAQNVHRNIEIDLDFRFKFDKDSLELFSGSTKIRLVLAIHAAFFEHYISEPSNPFRFIILDTPKQQEIHTSDLSKYLTQLENICMNHNAQLIFSSTEYDHSTQQWDKRWLPTYSGPKQPMYLGSPTQRV